MTARPSLWSYANPKRFLDVTTPALPWLFGLGGALFAGGLAWGFLGTPAERVQGESVKIIYLHVPSAFAAINIWFVMLLASLVWLVRRHHVSALAARAAAPVGLVMCAVGLWTGAVWGQPTWGTWWVWDPRLTSFLVLALFYLGYIALWQAIEDAELAADLTALVCLVGSVFAALSRYAAVFWAQGLHQPASLSLDAEENVADVFWYPLVACLAGIVLLSLALVLMRTQTEIRARRLAALDARARRLEP